MAIVSRGASEELRSVVLHSPGILEEVRLRCIAHPAKPFCISRVGGAEVRLDYAALWRGASAVATQLRARGCSPGDVVLIFETQRPEAYLSFLGAMMIGAIPSFMPYPNPKQNQDLYWSGHEALLQRIEPRLLLVHPAIADLFRERLPGFADRVMLARSDLAAADPQGLDPTALVVSDPAFMQHSSGTTSLKKGVMLSHAAVLAHTRTYRQAIGFGPDDIIASWLPLYHDMGLIACFMLPVITGATLVNLDPFEWVGDPLSLLRVIQEYRATYCWLPNFAFNHLAKAVRSQVFDLSSMRAFLNCSEPCRADSFDLFQSRLQGSGVTAEMLQVCYAMAENTFAVTQTELARPVMRLRVDRQGLEERGVAMPGEGPVLLSCGPVVQGVGVRIVDQVRRDLAAGQIGEVAISSDFLFEGYYRLPELSARKLEGRWYYSGDIGFLHGGELFITGRMDDLISVYGRNYYAHEVEALASAVEGVVPGRCVAFAVTNAAAGTKQVVLVAESRESADKHTALRRALATAVADGCGLALHQVHIVALGWLIKTTSGKISREKNRERFIRDKGLA